MSELFVELFSEEIPAKLQINARNELKKNIKNFFIDNQIKFNENFNVYSTPNRLVLHIDKIPTEIKLNSEEISCLLYTSPSPRDLSTSRMPSSA